MLEVQVGVWDKGMVMMTLMENRLPPAHQRRCGIYLKEGTAGCVRVECENKGCLLALADVLADIVLEELQVRFLARRLQRDYAFVEESDRGRILLSAVKRLWCSRAEEAEAARREVSDRIAVCLLENPSGRLFLEGVLYFRLKERVSRWEKTLEDCVDDFLNEDRRQEFVSLLRYLVSMREPAAAYVKICQKGEEYLLKDEEGRSIRVVVGGRPVPEEPGQDKRDALLSALVHLAPLSIDASLLADGELKDLLCRIFPGRMRF
ncbi:MAG: hypothetical protein IJP03_02935 [Christensenellaceae bacterium]|nr:hypothetical protein [Christensenellaceae bacterium]